MVSQMESGCFMRNNSQRNNSRNCRKNSSSVSAFCYRSRPSTSTKRWLRSRATRSRPITRWTSRLVCTSIPHTTKPSQLYAGLVSAGMVASIVGILPLAAMMAAHRLLQEAGRRGSESSAAARTERADDSMTSWASLTTVTSSLRSRSTRHSVTREEHPSQKRSSGPRSPSSCATSNPRVSAASTPHDDDRSVRV